MYSFYGIFNTDRKKKPRLTENSCEIQSKRHLVEKSRGKRSAMNLTNPTKKKTDPASKYCRVV